MGIWKRMTLIILWRKPNFKEALRLKLENWIGLIKFNRARIIILVIKLYRAKITEAWTTFKLMLMINSGWLEHDIYTLNKHIVLDFKGFLQLEICYFFLHSNIKKNNSKIMLSIAVRLSDLFLCILINSLNYYNDMWW